MNELLLRTRSRCLAQNFAWYVTRLVHVISGKSCDTMATGKSKYYRLPNVCTTHINYLYASARNLVKRINTCVHLGPRTKSHRYCNAVIAQDRTVKTRFTKAPREISPVVHAGPARAEFGSSPRRAWVKRRCASHAV